MTSTRLTRPHRSVSTAPADPTAVGIRLDCAPPYGLRDASGRHGLLAEWTSLVAGLAAPAQVWHGRRACVVDVPGSGAAAVLARELAASATPRQTLVYPAVGAPAEVPAPVVVAECRRGVEFEDGRVGAVLALTGWPAALTPGWLGPVAELCETVVVSLRPVPGPVAARLLRRRLAALTSTALLDEEAGRLGDPGLAVAAETAEDLRLALARGTARLVHAQVLLGLAAATPSGLAEQVAAVGDVLAAGMGQARALSWQHAPAWRALTPGAAPLRWPWRLLDAASAAASIPHPVGPQGPSRGVLAGMDPESGVPLLADRFAAHNPGRLVVGTSGAGKSYAAKLELMRQLAGGAAGVVIDPEGEFGRLGDVLGGLTLAVGEEPAGLDPVGLATRPGLAPAEGLSVLAAWASALVGAALSAVDLALLDRALVVLRADRAGRSSATPATMPTTGDLLSVLDEVAGHPPFTGADLPARLAPAAAGSVAELFAPNPDLADPPDLVVFDLRAVPARVRPAVMSCVLAWAWTQTVGAGVLRRRLVVVDEAHLLLDDPPAADLLAQFARRARKYGVALEVVTQRLSDFLGHPAGEAVLANAAAKLLLGCEDHERTAITTGLGLTVAEAALLRPGDTGRGLLLTPKLRTPIRIVAADAEDQLAAAGPRRRAGQ